jgi:hypothetical protein
MTRQEATEELARLVDTVHTAINAAEAFADANHLAFSLNCGGWYNNPALLDIKTDEELAQQLEDPDSELNSGGYDRDSDGLEGWWQASSIGC